MEVLVAGDFCPRNRVAALFDKGDYASVLGEVKPIIEQADYSIVNFECPVTNGGEKPIEKCGPNLQCSEKGMEAVKWAGFNCVTLANNHFLDYGEPGVRNALNACQKNELDTVGGGMNLYEASQISYKIIDGKTLGIINCCEHEFSIATKYSAGSNPLNPIQQYYAIKEARKEADYVLLIVHGGHELWQLPSPRMVETYRFFVDAGADAVVNHHQHCFSGYEIYKDKPIIYGLGNFCFDKPDYCESLWRYGYMISFNFSERTEMTIYPYKQCGEEPIIELLKNKNMFDKKIKELNAIIASQDDLWEKTTLYYAKGFRATQMAFQPYHGRLLSKLFQMGWLPNFLTKRKKLKLRNMIECEAHRDKTIYYLTH